MQLLGFDGDYYAPYIENPNTKTHDDNTWVQVGKIEVPYAYGSEYYGKSCWKNDWDWPGGYYWTGRLWSLKISFVIEIRYIILIGQSYRKNYLSVQKIFINNLL